MGRGGVKTSCMKSPLLHASLSKLKLCCRKRWGFESRIPYSIRVGLAQVLQSKDAPLKTVIGQSLQSLRPQSL